MQQQFDVGSRRLFFPSVLFCVAITVNFLDRLRVWKPNRRKPNPRFSLSGFTYILSATQCSNNGSPKVACSLPSLGLEERRRQADNLKTTPARKKCSRNEKNETFKLLNEFSAHSIACRLPRPQCRRHRQWNLIPPRRIARQIWTKTMQKATFFVSFVVCDKFQFDACLRMEKFPFPE